MANYSENTKRLTKNTLLLYFRMIVTTIISLITARYTLLLLGVDDYGISNVVGGIMGFMAIVTATMTSASQRFLAFELGRNDIPQFQRVYNMLINVFACFCVAVVIIMELAGPYLVSEVLVIPDDRVYAAQCLFQFTIINFVLGTMIIPFQSAIIAHEKIGIYAYFTIIDVLFKLLAVVSLYFTPIDKLITYGLVTTLLYFCTFTINLLYCFLKLNGCRFQKYWDFTLFKKIASYSGWNMLGSTSYVMTTQGQTILINLFFGPIVNAAKAIADKINFIVSSFCTNFYMALSPQIVKSYANGDVEYTKKLVVHGSKFAYLLLLVLSVPLVVCMEDLLNLWLGKEQVSSEMIIFSRLVLGYSLINCLEPPLTQVIRATGNIKKYQIVIGLQTLLFIPFAWLVYELGAPAYSSMICLCAVYLIVLFSRIRIIKPIINLSITDYSVKVLLPLFMTTLLCAFCFLLNNVELPHIFVTICFRLIASFVISCSLVLMIGLSKHERGIAINYILKRFKQKK